MLGGAADSRLSGPDKIITQLHVHGGQAPRQESKRVLVDPEREQWVWGTMWMRVRSSAKSVAQLIRPTYSGCGHLNGFSIRWEIEGGSLVFGRRDCAARNGCLLRLPIFDSSAFREASGRAGRFSQLADCRFWWAKEDSNRWRRGAGE